MNIPVSSSHVFGKTPAKRNPLYSDLIEPSILKDKSLLLIDPNKSSRDGVKQALSHGWITQIHELSDVTSYQIVRTISEKVFDIIVCEEVLPKDESGTALLDSFREDELLSHQTIFIITTGAATTDRVTLAAENVADDFLQKRELTAARIEERILSAIQKKIHFTEVYKSIDKGDRVSAIRKCDELIARFENERRKIDESNMFSKPESIARQDRLRSYMYYARRLQAEQYLRNGQFERAQAIYASVIRSAIEKKPVYWAECGLGESLLGLGKLEEAEKMFVDVLAKNSAFVRCHERLAETYELMGKKEAAIKALQVTKEKSPLKLSRIVKLADMAMEHGDFGAAEEALSHVVAVGGKRRERSPAVFSRLAKVQVLSGNSDNAKKTMDDMRRAFQGDPKRIRQAELSTAAMQAWMLDQEAKKALESGDEQLAKKIALKIPEQLAKFTQLQCDDALLDPELVPDFIATCLRCGDKGLADNLMYRFLKNPKNPEQARKKITEAVAAEFGFGCIEKVVSNIANEVKSMFSAINDLMKWVDKMYANRRLSVLANEFCNDLSVLCRIVVAKSSILHQGGWNEKVYMEMCDLLAWIDEKGSGKVSEYASAKWAVDRVNENIVKKNGITPRKPIPAIPFIDGVTNNIAKGEPVVLEADDVIEQFGI